MFRLPIAGAELSRWEVLFFFLDALRNAHGERFTTESTQMPEECLR